MFKGSDLEINFLKSRNFCFLEFQSDSTRLLKKKLPKVSGVLNLRKKIFWVIGKKYDYIEKCEKQKVRYVRFDFLLKAFLN